MSVPESCPGVGSPQAGKAGPCEGCPNQSICSSGPTIDPAVSTIAQRLKNVTHKILILSGKGGVGKSTVTASLAYALTSIDSKKLGVLDIDITGPSIPRLFGVSGSTVHQSASGWCPVYVDDAISCMSIAFMLPKDDDAVIWRGPKKTAMIKQFLTDVDWGDLDLLLIDTPPGTSDEHLAAVQYLSDAQITGAIVVTTPQEVSIQDVQRELVFCQKVKIPVIGVIENMASFVCPKCAHCEPIFAPVQANRVQEMCRKYNVKYLGAVPLDPLVSKACDSGESFIDKFPESPASAAYLSIVSKLELNKV